MLSLLRCHCVVSSASSCAVMLRSPYFDVAASFHLRQTVLLCCAVCAALSLCRLRPVRLCCIAVMSLCRPITVILCCQTLLSFCHSLHCHTVLSDLAVISVAGFAVILCCQIMLSFCRLIRCHTVLSDLAVILSLALLSYFAVLLCVSSELPVMMPSFLSYCTVKQSCHTKLSDCAVGHVAPDCVLLRCLTCCLC